MTRSQLIKALIKDNPKLSLEFTNRVVNTIIKTITKALVQGDRVELRGFGSFSVRKRAAREARNPRNNEIIKVAGRAVTYFRMGKEFKERINNSQ